MRKNLSDSYGNAVHATASAAEPSIGAHVAFTAPREPLRWAQSRKPTETEMDERDSELVLTLINEAGSAALKAALALQLANTASLMTTLVDKGLLTAEDTA